MNDIENTTQEEEDRLVLPEWRYPTLNADGTVDCEILHSRFGWISFTASASDPEEQGRVLHQVILAAVADIPATVIPLEDLVAAKLEGLEADLNARLGAGMPYGMPDGSQDIVQTRAEDESNLLGLAIEARDLRDAGVIDDQMTLRTKSNRLYALTPLEMITLTNDAKAFKQRLLAKSWALKDAVAVAAANGDRAALEAITWENEQ